ncbi:hypothetical protein FRC02_006259 [Tulasnella sp. 418]|nr:hypothetical protein FRC02_006259 [Tulasnella sp. 418]
MTNIISILVINPNSSQSVTDILESSIPAPPGTSLSFFTGPSEAPSAINDEETAQQSLKACLPLLLNTQHTYDAYLVACYSDHPLVPALRQHLPRKPVIGILEASISHAMLIGKKFGIVTTGKPWEDILTKNVNDYLGVEGRIVDGVLRSGSSRFACVASTGLGVLELHDAPGEIVNQNIGEAAIRVLKEGADAICLGCAGMVGLDESVRKGVQGMDISITIVDGVASGIELLAGMCRTISKPSN